MTITLTIDPSWLAVPIAASRLFLALHALERPRQPGDDGDDLAELLDGIDTPEPAATPARGAGITTERLDDHHTITTFTVRAPAATPSPAAATPRAAATFDGVPTTGRQLYRWATTNKALPRVNAIGKGFGYPKLVSDWEPGQVAAAYRILTEPAANGQASR
jgi:hypothetical protein